MKKFRQSLYGRKSTILIDYRSLMLLFNLKLRSIVCVCLGIKLEKCNYETRYKQKVQSSKCTITNIKKSCYRHFLKKFEYTLITNKNIKKVNRNLMQSSVEYNIS